SDAYRRCDLGHRTRSVTEKLQNPKAGERAQRTMSLRLVRQLRAPALISHRICAQTEMMFRGGNWASIHPISDAFDRARQGYSLKPFALFGKSANPFWRGPGGRWFQ